VAPVILFPAIDLKDGQCVRLIQGDMARATIFNADPAAQARAFVAQGFDYLHVVDLDGAFAGKPMNAEAVRHILAGLTVKLQLGGGIRDMKTVRGWLESGVTRVIIGTAAVGDPDFVREAARLYPGRIAVGVDAREGIVAIEGWAKTSDISALDLAWRQSSIPILRATACSPASTSKARSRSPTGSRFRSSPLAASPRSRTSGG
jgi:phosphoribosylformimino-5-aminoimidazole carboxamide ribotide isomerase